MSSKEPYKFPCPECDGEVDGERPADEILNGEVYHCLSCGLPIEAYRENGKLKIRELILEEGEDFGE